MPEFDLTPLRAAIAELMPQGQAALLPALHIAQAMYGYLPEPIAAEIGRALNVPLADVYGVIDFYSMFYREPVGRTIVRVCCDPVCALRGADAVLGAARRKANLASSGDTSADGLYTVERSPCLGLCHAAVGVNVSHNGRGASLGNVTPDDLDDVFAARARPIDETVGGDVRVATALCGENRLATLAEYQASGGLQALRKVLVERVKPETIVDELKRSGLFGRGGAAFPTWIKWDGAAKAPDSPKYLVVNGDESEPGTFKDRILMERDPHHFIEGAIIGAYTIGARQVYVYIRGEYPLAAEGVNAALAEWRAAGYLGENILDSGFSVDCEVRGGAGAYICGEETALFESIEGKRGFPRVKPPFPTEHGLFGKPTVINNVETLAKVPYIMAHGAEGFRRFGSDKSTGPKLFCVSGDVARPGLYEMRFDATLRHLLDDLAGGVVGELKAILIGGAAGAFATEKDLDVKLTVEDLRAAGLPLGSGAIMVFNQSRDVRDVLLRLARFFAHESCGKCYPCQLGTQRQMEILERFAAGRAQPGDRERLSDVGWTMSDASLCGLGQTAAWAVQSAMKLWPDLFT